MRSRQWTIYIAQDKHLDYNWCGSLVEVETRMAALVDYYLDLTRRTDGRWNLDGTLWLEVYRRQRGDAAAGCLLRAVREGRIGYAGNRAVLLWGLLSSELAIRACYDALPIEEAAGRPCRTALIMENAGLPWGIAGIVAAGGFLYLGRGIYSLRAESYYAEREPYPLFWWVGPGGQRLLVHWDLYSDTGSWGGYAEAFELARLAGETWDALHIRDYGDRNTEEVYRRRVAFIEATIERYEAYGDAYPVSSILLLGSGWDNWTRTDDIAAFIRRFNASDGDVRLVDARYEEYFEAVSQEVEARGLALPTQEGTFGICWEEWAAHLAGPTADFREAERLLRQVEAVHALETSSGSSDEKRAAAIRQGYDALLRFAEHDFGGVDRARAAISAGVRAAAATEALSIGRGLSPEPDGVPWQTLTQPADESLSFAWRGGRVSFDGRRCVVASLVDGEGREWVPQDAAIGLGEFVHTRYGEPIPGEVFPEVLPHAAAAPVVRRHPLQAWAGGRLRRDDRRTMGVSVVYALVLPCRSTLDRCCLRPGEGMVRAPAIGPVLFSAGHLQPQLPLRYGGRHSDRRRHCRWGERSAGCQPQASVRRRPLPPYTETRLARICSHRMPCWYSLGKQRSCGRELRPRH